MSQVMVIGLRNSKINLLVWKSFHQGNMKQTWFDATLVFRFNECNRRSYNS